MIVRERHGRGVSDLDNEIGVSFAGSMSQRSRALDPHYLIATLLESSCNPSLSATDVHDKTLRRRQQ